MLDKLSWPILANFCRTVLQVLLNIVLAYYLSPSEYGLIALVLPVTLLILLVGDLGFSAVIVRTDRLMSQDVDVAMSMLFMFGIAVLTFAIGAYLSGAFNFLPAQLGLLIVGFAFVVFFAISAVVPRALLERKLEYKVISGIETISSLFGASVAFFCAHAGWGVWSFLFYHIILQLSRSIGFFQFAKYRPHFTLDKTGLKKLFTFGSWVVGFSITNFFSRNFDNYIIGGLLGTAALGSYAISYQIMLLPLAAITWPISGVLVSMLSKIRQDPIQFKTVFLNVLSLVASITVPAMSFVAGFGSLVIKVFLSEHWQAAGITTERLAIAGALQSLTSFVGVVFIVNGLVKKQFYIGIVTTILTLSAIAVAARFGSLVDVVNTYVGLAIAYTIFYAKITKETLQCRYHDLIVIVAPSMCAVIFSFILYALAISVSWEIKSDVQHLITGFICFAFGTLSAGLLFRRHLTSTFIKLRELRLSTSDNTYLEVGAL